MQSKTRKVSELRSDFETDFGFLATIVKNDMLGIQLTRDQQRTLEAIYAKAAAKG